MRNIIFYSSYYEAIKELPDDIQGAVYKAVIDYAMEQIEPNLSGIAKSIFTLIKPSIDSAKKNYENGKKGGKPTKKKGEETQTQTEQITDGITQTQTDGITQSVTQAETESLTKKEKENKNNKKNTKKEKVKKEKNSVFIPPTFEEVKAYAEERNKGVNAQKFYDYYSASNWKDKKGEPVLNWKLKMVSVWEKPKESDCEAPLERAARVIGGF